MSALSSRETETDTAKTNVSSQLLHDLRSPLNQIIGYAELLAEIAEGQRPEDFVKDVARIRTAGLRMLALIDGNFTAAEQRSVALAVNDDDEETLPAPAAVEQRAVVPGTVLVVDDDATNRNVLCRRLKRQGHRVETAVSGRSALKLMREADFDLVLLDIMMPDMDGYEVLGHLKTDVTLQHIPVIMISALSELQSVVRCIEAGAEDYLTKPFNPTLLRARIGACLEKKRSRDREADLFAQLENNYQRLQQAEKLRDDMRNMIVHDLRTPLTSVIVGVGMLKTDRSLSEEQRELIAIAVTGGKTLLGMINDLLDVEKMESGSSHLAYVELVPVALVAGAIGQVVSLAQEARTTILTEIADGLPSFPGDENKLSRTLVNLIGNAIKFTPGGTVTVAASRDEQSDSIQFAVRDTGQGIPAEAFERIFEKFGQLDSHNRAGTGLGLAFCKLAVEAHGGRIQVESTLGVGSTFSFTVPRQIPFSLPTEGRRSPAKRDG